MSPNDYPTYLHRITWWVGQKRHKVLRQHWREANELVRSLCGRDDVRWAKWETKVGKEWRVVFRLR